jgi:hypothetical protein
MVSSPSAGMRRLAQALFTDIDRAKMTQSQSVPALGLELINGIPLTKEI